MNHSALHILENLTHLRNWRRDNFKNYESPAAYDLIIFLALEFARGETFTVKQLFASIPYSYTAVRRYYKQLISDGLILSVPDISDGRIKYIQSTDEFIVMIDSYTQEVSRRFPQYRNF